MKTLWTVALLVAGVVGVARLAYAGDRQFDRLVGAIETHYGTAHTRIPFMGVASLFVKVAHPDGATGLRLAVFEDLKSSGDDWAERDRFIESLTDGLHPLVRTHSRRSGEATYILASGSGKSTEMLLVVFERNEATAMQVKFDKDLLHLIHEQ
jgi:hypothetical protein